MASTRPAASLANLKRGNTKNVGRKPTKSEFREWAREKLESGEYRESAWTRILEGRAAHLEKLLIERLWPETKHLEVGFGEGATLRILNVNLPPESSA